MYTYKNIFVIPLLLIGQLALSQAPNLGETPSQEMLSSWDTTIDPLGRGLPDGSGTAEEGQPVFLMKCAACHGVEGEGLINDRLVGGHGTIGSDRAVKTVGSYWPYATTLYDYIRRAMPYINPHSLSDQEVFQLTAYILYLNDIIEVDERLDKNNLANIEMPNRLNFFSYEYELP